MKNGVIDYAEQRPWSLEPHKIIEQMVAISPEYQPLYGSCCNKLVRCACYNSVNNPVKFEPKDLSIGEDVVFNCRLLMTSAKRISYLNRAFYHYEVRGGSLTKKIGDGIQYLIKIQENIIKDKDICECLSLKPLHLQILFAKKEFGKMKNLYPQTKAAIISKYPHSPLSLALKGYPRIAYLLYRVKVMLGTKTCDTSYL